MNTTIDKHTDPATITGRTIHTNGVTGRAVFRPTPHRRGGHR